MQQNNLLFDHLVGEQQYRGWHFEAKLLRDFEIDGTLLGAGPGGGLAPASIFPV
jgi:hypothetical protein